MLKGPRIREDSIDSGDPKKPGSPNNPIELSDEDILAVEPLTRTPQPPASQPPQMRPGDSLMDQLGSRDIDPSVFLRVVRDRLRDIGLINKATSDDHVLGFREGGDHRMDVTDLTGPTFTVNNVAALESAATKRIMAAARAAREAGKTPRQRAAGRKIRKALQELQKGAKGI